MKLIYVPVQLISGLDGPFLVDTSDGWIEEVPSGRLELVDRRFCLVGIVTGADQTGRVEVMFANRRRVWVYQSPAWAYLPHGSEQYTIDGLAVMAA